MGTDQEEGPSWIGITNCQFLNGDIAVTGDEVELYNVLISAPDSGDGIISFYTSLIGENVTVDAGAVFALGWGTTALTNCLLTCPQVSPGTLITNSTVWLPSHTNLYQIAGAGGYYLADHTNRYAGTTNINPALLAGLRQRTTYPPIVYAPATMSSSRAMSPMTVIYTQRRAIGGAW